MTPIRLLLLLATLFAASSAVAQRVWFVDNAAKDGDGSQARPFTTIAAAREASAAGDAILLVPGKAPYRESLALRERQLLAAASSATAPLLQSRGIAIAEALAGAGELPLVELAEPIALANGAALANLRLRTSGVAVRGEKIAGITLDNVTIVRGERKPSGSPCDLEAEAAVDCRATIQLLDVDGATLTAVRVDDTNDSALYAARVTNLTLASFESRKAGDEAREHGLQLRDLRGRALLDRVVVEDSAARQLFIVQRAGEAAIEIHRSRFDGGPAPNGGQGLLVQTANDAKLTIAIDDSDFVQHVSDGIHAIGDGSSMLALSVSKNRFAGNASAINVVAANGATVRYAIAGNETSGSTSAAINISAGITGSKGSLIGSISDNTIGRSGAAGSGARCGSCSGIAIDTTRGGIVEAVVTGNVIQQVDGFGIRSTSRGSGQVRLEIARNLVREPHGGDVLSAIAVQAGARKGDSVDVCADIRDNTISGGWDPLGGAPISVTNKLAETSLALPGYSGKGDDAPAVAKFLQSRNKSTIAKANLNTSAGSAFSAAAPGACTTER